MWLILQQEEPDDYVLATGETHSVREFVEAAFGEVGSHDRWKGTGADEKGTDTQDRQGPGRGRSAVLPADRGRPADAAMPRKARQKLGWKHNISFHDLVQEMVRNDMKLLKQAPGSNI